jgi:hypothetical protein
MVTLRRLDRLCEINLYVTISMLTSIVQVTETVPGTRKHSDYSRNSHWTIYTSPECIFGWFCPASLRNQAGWCSFPLPGNTKVLSYKEPRRASPFQHPG